MSAISSTGVGEMLDRLLELLPAPPSADDIRDAGGAPKEEWCVSIVIRHRGKGFSIRR